MYTAVARRLTRAKGIPSSKNRLLNGFAILSAAAILVASTAANAATAEFVRAHSFAARSGVQKARPVQEKVTVVVEMAGDSVASARALSADRTITSERRDSIRIASARQAASLEPEITARGGRVLARFHNAINGVKARIDRSQIESLRNAPGVVAVRPVRTYKMNNVESVPFIGAPLAWQGSPSFRGEGQKVAVIDTGIDYTHANFGGPGTVDAFNTAKAASTGPADPALFGSRAPKVKGGTDLVGDAYDADGDDAAATPHPDPNPLDCNGHGSHVAGTAVGYGVGADGKTYKGPYTAAAIQPANFIIGPGVAPKADLYSVRVFGCEGTTSVVVDAIEWAIDHDMDVINMSLGSVYGSADDADAVEVDNAAKAGVVVITSSGNSGPAPYITGSPGVSDGAVSVASVDSHPSYPYAQIMFDTGSVLAIDANGAPLPGGTLQVVVLKNADGSLSLGCNEAEYVDTTISGKMVVTLRGVCPRVDRATFGARHGAAAVVMINTDDGYPPFEGPIANVNIPFLGVPATDGTTIVAKATSANQFVAQNVANGAYKRASDFSSAGPRSGDGVLKPNVTAPGTSIFSTNVGTGNQGIFISGTSMASPHVAGVAALTRQAHPRWDPKSIRAAIVQTADPKALLDYAPSLEGSGLVQPLGATRTQAVAFSEGPGAGQSVAFGFEEFLQNFHDDRTVTVRNFGDKSISFNVTSTRTGGVAHTLNLSRSTITIGAHQEARLNVALAVSPGTVGTVHDDLGNLLFQEIAGYLKFTPVSSSMNNGVALTLPYYMVARARSNVLPILTSQLSPRRPNARVLVSNIYGGVTGTADFYAWGLHNKKKQGVSLYDTRAVGVQSFPAGPPDPNDPTHPPADDQLVVFAINTFERFSAANLGRFDVLVDVDGDKKPDYDVLAIDRGLWTSGDLDGQMVTVVQDVKTGAWIYRFAADAPTDGSTLLLIARASDFKVTSANPRFSYTATITNLNDGTTADLPGRGRYNAFSPSISNADASIGLDPNKVTFVPVSIDRAEWAKTPALGLMVVSEDNLSGGEKQGILLPVK